MSSQSRKSRENPNNTTGNLTLQATEKAPHLPYNEGTSLPIGFP